MKYEKIVDKYISFVTFTIYMLTCLFMFVGIGLIYEGNSYTLGEFMFGKISIISLNGFLFASFLLSSIATLLMYIYKLKYIRFYISGSIYLISGILYLISNVLNNKYILGPTTIISGVLFILLGFLLIIYPVVILYLNKKNK